MSDDSYFKEYEAATQHAAVVPLSNWTAVSITGADRASFLHNMCTNDIRNLAVGDGVEAFFTDVKGKIVGHGHVLADDNRLVLLTVPEQAQRFIEHLSKYIIREDVQLADASLASTWSLVTGPQAEQAIEACQGGQSDSPGDDFRLFRCKAIWTTSVFLREQVGKPHGHSYKNLASPRVSDAVWHALRIESGWPLFGVDFDGSNLPQEVARDERAISFRKGCYLGQETVARIDALGHVNQRLATVRAKTALATGNELTADGKLVGRITSASFSPRLDAWLALAMIRRGHNEPGDTLTSGDVTVEVVRTPAVNRLLDN